ncbi:MurR/RpiR family transcriptional regulator [Pseudonocardia sp. C8]|nr:MurR/RpiR family transcriptional regulator [Pseudonocardia sp. C8]
MLGRLVASEQRVATVLLDHPEQVLHWSVAEIADAASTSTATVVRTCKSLGFTGLQQLRLALAREVPDRPPPEPATVAAVFATAIESLRLGADTIDQAQVDGAVAALAAANRRLFVGTGASAPPVQDAAFRFVCAGWPTEAPADNVAQLLTARLLAPDDVCLAVSHSGANRPTLAAVAAAREAGATTIGISSFADSALIQQVDVPLVAGTAVGPMGTDVVTGRVSHVLLLHALQVGIARSAPGVSRHAQTKLAGLLDGLAAESPRDHRDAWTL